MLRILDPSHLNFLRAGDLNLGGNHKVGIGGIRVDVPFFSDRQFNRNRALTASFQLVEVRIDFGLHGAFIVASLER